MLLNGKLDYSQVRTLLNISANCWLLKLLIVSMLFISIRIFITHWVNLGLAQIGTFFAQIWLENFHNLLSNGFEGLSVRGTDENAICNPDKYHKTLPTSALVAIDTIQDLLCELGMKPHMHLMETIICSLSLLRESTKM